MIGQPRAVVLIHGINSRGSWYDTANAVLGKHFHCWFHRYDGYHQLGFVRVIISLRGLALAALAALVGGLAWWHQLLPALVIVPATVGLMILFVVYGVCHAAKRRRNRIHELAHRIETLGPPRPHVIAHSYGAYLTSRVLLDYMPQGAATVAHGVDRVVFWGAVVTAEYPWRRMLESRRVNSVRNDVGRRDRVVSAVQRCRRFSLGLLDRLVPGVGNAGLVGFTSLPAADARFEFDHSTALQNKYTAIARYYWLPFLWGIDPQQHARFCETLTEAGDRAKAPGGSLRDYDALLAETYDWTNRSQSPCTLGELVTATSFNHDVARKRHRPTQVNERQIQRWVCQYMYEVSQNHDIRDVNPFNLVSTCVERVLKKVFERYDEKNTGP